MLPDDTLLEIFTFYVDEARGVDGWHTLIHVCQRWRTVIWPALPIIISDRSGAMEGAHDIIAALEHNDRVT